MNDEEKGRLVAAYFPEHYKSLPFESPILCDKCGALCSGSHLWKHINWHETNG